MHRNKTFIKRLMFILLCMGTGVFIYWMLSPGIILFKTFGIQNAHPLSMTRHPGLAFIKNYIPDFLWATAVFNTAALLKEKNIPIAWIYSLVLLPFVSEILQQFKYIPGTFDPYDLLVYAIALVFSFYSKIIQLCKNYSGSLSGPQYL